MPFFGASIHKSRPKSSHWVVMVTWLGYLLCGSSANATPTYALGQLLDIAAEQNPAINISRAREDSASAAVITANTYINPQLEVGAGPSHYRTRG